MPPITVQQAFELALQHHQAGRLAEAEALYRQILAVQPQHADALHLLGVIAHQVGRNDLAVDLIRQAIALAPGNPASHSNLGAALKKLGCFNESIASYRYALQLDPGSAKTHCNLGNVLRDAGQADEAIAECRLALQIEPDFPEAHNNLGNALRDRGRLDEAVGFYHAAIQLRPGYADAYNNLGAALADLERFEEALAAYRQAIALKGDYPEAHYNLGTVLSGMGKLDDAIAAYYQAIALKSDYPEAYTNLGNTLKDNGQLDEAVAAYRQAIALQPSLSAAHSNLLLTLNYHPALDPFAIAEEHRRWNQEHAEPLRQFILPHGNDRDPARPLRIGYVSPDLCGHAVAPMLLPLLACHDRAQFQVYCYAQVLRPDGMTARFRLEADQWRSTVGVSDEEVARQIREDRIDILVDLAGHTADSRLLVFARKPAPVQVTRQGYPNTTGMTTIDYRMTDALADPPGLSDRLHSEHLIRLPRTNWIYEPPSDSPVPMARPGDTPFIFGCFNNFTKVTEPMLRVWARILAAVPDSRLLLKARVLDLPEVRKRVEMVMKEEGIAPERLELVGPCESEVEHLLLYNQVSVALDPFPYHGTTTTCEALWMGVPVISLAGRTHVSRVGVSLLTNLGLPELIAESPDAYVNIAVELSRDLPRLHNLHATLRQRMKESPLMDAPRFARDMEAAYREMWRKWCAEVPGDCTAPPLRAEPLRDSVPDRSHP